MISISFYDSPCGELILGSYQGKLCLCDWMIEERRKKIDKRIQSQLFSSYQMNDTSLLQIAKQQLDEYFSRRRFTFDLSPLLIGTNFQKSVWHELSKVPYGVTCSYLDIALRIGKPKAVRAVASAIGANPISIIIPCHRIVGSKATLNGYAGGLIAKRKLLDLEQGTLF